MLYKVIRIGKKCDITLKLNMSKAYNRIEWCFLERIIKQMCFVDTWIKLVMRYITTVSFSFSINGEVK